MVQCIPQSLTGSLQKPRAQRTGKGKDAPGCPPIRTIRATYPVITNPPADGEPACKSPGGDSNRGLPDRPPSSTA